MKTTNLFLTGLAAAVLTACGGGGDSQAPAASAPATTKISGTAAVGAALGNASVQAKCASGSGTATTAADGTFTIDIPNATRPCVLSVTTPDGTTLHSVVEAGSGTTATANITPLTELITASLAQGDTDAFFNQFDASAQARLTPSGLSTATEAVKLVLTGVVDLTGVDPLKGALVAANGNTAGNAQDKLLDQLGERLESSKTTLDELSSAVASNAGATAVQTALQPAAASCAGLRTGKYHLVGLSYPSGTIAEVDASALTITQKSSFGADATSGPSLTLTPDAAEACRFTVASGGSASTVLMSKSGVGLVVPAVATSSVAVGMLIPAQSLTLADLAGNWNGLGYEREDAGSPLKPSRVTLSLDAAGKATAGADCTGLNSCESWPAAELPTFSAIGNGIFGFNDLYATAQPVYTFKGTDGQVMAVIPHEDGFMVFNKQADRALPVVGTSNAYWDNAVMYLPPLGGGTPVLNFTGTEKWSTVVESADTQTGIYTRKRVEDGRLDSWKQNVPAPGLRYREPSTAASESIAMVLGNTGVNVSIGVNNANFYSISVNRP
ncbi:hypothetical protein Tamer19_69420 [Cupriavidus sp. TA19]|uniref:hypothetical protein n=1 Tax=unclassified Cupriavidus TaxID=2640874 RepID=UPI0027294DF7|nr:hypothetical protein [Cupriavidus sp. TA19]GLC97533.1 hypothetical protein Tamer19_69420 [Cupriavidus sp. TA19]